jgi:uncharacterized protein YodC (DUF2158 family)
MNQEPEFHIGDIVHLTSGSPRLRVVAIGEVVTVAWRDDKFSPTQYLSSPAVCFHKVEISS